MPVYSEPVSDEILLKKLTDSSHLQESKNILIVGCGGCANISCNLYHANNEPAFNLLFTPISINREINRVKALLNENKYNVDSCNILALCHYSEGIRKKIAKNAQGKDTVIVMSCPGGQATVSKIVDDKKIVNGMKLRGIKSIKLNIKGGKIYIKET